MARRLRTSTLLASLIAGSGALAGAQPARVFVSVAGADNPACAGPRRPCRTLGAAVAKVRDGGAVIIVRSGAYGGAVVDRSVTIAAAPGAHAVLQRPLIAAPGATGAVVLRELTLDVPDDRNAILHESGRLWVESVSIDGGARGIWTRPSAGDLTVVDSAVIDATEEALRIDAANRTLVRNSRFEGARISGLLVGGAARITLEDSAFSMTGEFGMAVNGAARVRARRCLFSLNGGAGVNVGAAGADVSIADSEIVDNVDLVGLSVIAGTVRLSGSTVAGNPTGLIQRFDGVLESYGDNRLRGNTFESFGTITTVPLR